MKELLCFLTSRTAKDASNVGGYGLKHIKDNVYIPSFYVNSPFYLKNGCEIWICNNDNFDIYKLTEDTSEEELLHFVDENIV